MNTNGRQNLFALSGVISIEKILYGPEFLQIFVRIIQKFLLTVFVFTRFHCSWL